MATALGSSVYILEAHTLKVSQLDMSLRRDVKWVDDPSNHVVALYCGTNRKQAYLALNTLKENTLQLFDNGGNKWLRGVKLEHGLVTRMAGNGGPMLMCGSRTGWVTFHDLRFVGDCKCLPVPTWLQPIEYSQMPE